jgi:hypothetical protein
MSDWIYAQNDPAERLARLHYFAVNKLQNGREIPFTITVKEFVTPPLGAMQFLAQADKQTNQKVAPYTPTGWGTSMMEALRLCIHEINRFPYDEDAGHAATV